MSEESHYIEIRSDTYYVRGREVELSQIILQWQAGALPESIALNFSGVTAAQVYGAVAYYLDHQADVS